jgi:hypothetical protein
MAGKIIADTLEHSTAGSIATNYVVNGVAKTWVYYDQSSGTGSIQDSLNVSSADDDGTGKQGINFTNSMGNALYSVGGFNEDGFGENDSIGIHRDGDQIRSASEFNYLCMSGTSKNEGKSSIQLHGDLA